MWITTRRGLAFARFGRQGKEDFHAGPSSVSSAPRSLAPHMSTTAPQVSTNKNYPHGLPTSFEVEPSLLAFNQVWPGRLRH